MARIAFSLRETIDQLPEPHREALLLECCHFELDRLGGIVGYEERCASCDLERRASGRP